MNARRPLVFAALVAGLVGALGSMSSEEVRCEEALAELRDCCPGLDPSAFVCDPVGCNAPPTAFTSADAECVLAASCDHVRVKGWCERLAARARGETGKDAGAYPSSTEPLCQ
jgi:hypothetical protein